MVNEPFKFRDKQISYNCGQPMGAYSSWCVFSLSHHIVCRIAKKRINNTSGSYMILGDDIVISGNHLAREYKKIMKDLGVSLSKAKTHTSNNMFEFAKRWYRDGVEISGIPIRGFLEARRHWWKVIPEWNDSLARVGVHDAVTAPGVFKKILKTLGHYIRLGYRAYMTVLTTGFMAGSEDKSMITISRLRNHIGSCNMSYKSQYDLMKTITSDLIAKNLEKSLMEVRKFTKEFPIKCTDCVVSSLTNLRHPRIQFLLKNLPPIVIGSKILSDAKNLLERMGDRDITIKEIENISKNSMPSNPIQLIQERKKDIIARSQANMSKEIVEFYLTQQSINRKAYIIDEPESLFIEQHRFLPRYSRRNVMFGYPLIGGVKT